MVANGGRENWKRKKGLRGKEKIKKMFPLYMFGSRERKGKEDVKYLLFMGKVNNAWRVFVNEPFLKSFYGKIKINKINK